MSIVLDRPPELELPELEEPASHPVEKNKTIEVLEEALHTVSLYGVKRGAGDCVLSHISRAHRQIVGSKSTFSWRQAGIIYFGSENTIAHRNDYIIDPTQRKNWAIDLLRKRIKGERARERRSSSPQGGEAAG